MKSLFMKSIYTGLGLLGTGSETVQELGRKLAKKVNISEKDGERIARDLRTRSEKAIASLQKSFDSEVQKIVKAMKPAAGHHKAAKKSRHRAAKGKASSTGA